MRIFKNPWKFYLILLILMGVIIISTKVFDVFLIYFVLVGFFVLSYISSHEERFSNSLIKNNIKIIKKITGTITILTFLASPFIFLYFIYWGIKEILRPEIPKIAKIFVSIQTILVIGVFVLDCAMWYWCISQYKKAKVEGE